MPQAPNFPVFGQLAATGLASPIGATAAVAAGGALTLVGNAVAGETVRIGGINATSGGWLYTWVTTLTNTAAGQVLIGASASVSCDNLIAAINGDAGVGTLYSQNTAQNSLVSASAGSGDSVVLAAREAGPAGNVIGTVETMSSGSFGATTLTGGTSSKLYVDATVTATAESTAEATAAAPSYTEGQDAPLSQDLAGNLRVLQVGAPTLNNAQQTSTGTAATLLIARPTRRGAVIRNVATTGSVWIGKATVTTGNGLELKAGENIAVTFTGITQIIDDTSTHCAVAFWDEY